MEGALSMAAIIADPLADLLADRSHIGARVSSQIPAETHGSCLPDTLQRGPAGAEGTNMQGEYLTLRLITSLMMCLEVRNTQLPRTSPGGGVEPISVSR